MASTPPSASQSRASAMIRRATDEPIVAAVKCEVRLVAQHLFGQFREVCRGDVGGVGYHQVDGSSKLTGKRAEEITLQNGDPIRSLPAARRCLEPHVSRWG